MTRVYGTGKRRIVGLHRRGGGVRSQTLSLTQYIEKSIKAFRVLAWERAFLTAWQKTRGDAALSVGRGNGKTNKTVNTVSMASTRTRVGPRVGPTHRGYLLTIFSYTVLRPS